MRRVGFLRALNALLAFVGAVAVHPLASFAMLGRRGRGWFGSRSPLFDWLHD